MRILLSILTAVLATLGGLVLTFHGASSHRIAFTQLVPDPSASGFGVVIALAGIVLLGLAAFSLALHWAGALLVGAVHTVVGLVALVVPLGSIQTGFTNPLFGFLAGLPRRDVLISDGATVFVFSGGALAVGLVLVVAALATRARRRAVVGTPSAVGPVLAAVVGGVVMLGGALVLTLVGSEFARSMLVMLRSDGVLAVFTVVAALLVGAAAISLRWSSVGVAVVGALVTVTGIVLLAAQALLGNAPVGFVGGHGVIAILGVTILGSAVGARVGSRAPRSAA